MTRLLLLLVLVLGLCSWGCARSSTSSPPPDQASGPTKSAISSESVEHVSGDEEGGLSAAQLRAKMKESEAAQERIEQLRKDGATGSQEVSQKDFQAPFFTSAKKVFGGRLSRSAADGRVHEYAVARLTTSQPLDEVARFYAAQIPSSIQKEVASPAHKTVVIRSHPDSAIQGDMVIIEEAVDHTLIQQYSLPPAPDGN